MAPHPESSGGGRQSGKAGTRGGPGPWLDSASSDEPASGPGPGSGEAAGDVSADQVSAQVVEEDLGEVLAVALKERDEYLDMLRRVQADFENYKKRMIRQQTELLDRAAQGIVEKLLPALDAFDLARAHLADSEALSEEGRALVQASALLFDALSKEGLERVDEVGVEFDPMTHDAVEHDTSAPGAVEEPADRPGAGPSPHGAPSAGGPAPEGEGPEVQQAHGPVVVGVLRPGYRWKGRVVRPAMVRVRG